MSLLIFVCFLSKPGNSVLESNLIYCYLTCSFETVKPSLFLHRTFQVRSSQIEREIKQQLSSSSWDQSNKNNDSHFSENSLSSGNESRISSLTETLLMKQALLEVVTSDKTALAFRVEKLEVNSYISKYLVDLLSIFCMGFIPYVYKIKYSDACGVMFCYISICSQ